MARARKDAARRDGAVEGDGEQDLEVAEANDDVLGGAGGANGVARAQEVGERFCEGVCGGLGEEVGGVGGVDV